MEKQTVRITLRMSEQLHKLLTEASSKIDRPLNKEIVRRLEATFSDNLLFQVSEKINDLDNNRPFTEAQEARLREVILEMMGK